MGWLEDSNKAMTAASRWGAQVAIAGVTPSSRQERCWQQQSPECPTGVCTGKRWWCFLRWLGLAAATESMGVGLGWRSALCPQKWAWAGRLKQSNLLRTSSEHHLTGCPPWQAQPPTTMTWLVFLNAIPALTMCCQPFILQCQNVLSVATVAQSSPVVQPAGAWWDHFATWLWRKWPIQYFSC